MPKYLQLQVHYMNGYAGSPQATHTRTCCMSLVVMSLRCSWCVCISQSCWVFVYLRLESLNSTISHPYWHLALHEHLCSTTLHFDNCIKHGYGRWSMQRRLWHFVGSSHIDTSRYTFAPMVYSRTSHWLLSFSTKHSYMHRITHARAHGTVS